jgi:riboflavin kinase/FMN adenylyltransferase
LAQPLVISVGTFDGVHRGHARLMARARELALPLGGRVVAMVFDPHPMDVLRTTVPGAPAAPARLSTFDQRRAWLTDAGADHVERIDPASGVLSLSPEQFVHRVIAEHAHLGPVGAWIEGPDFRFGQGRAGDTQVLTTLGVGCGFSTHIIEHLGVATSDHQIVPCRSSTVRRLLSAGRVFDAAALLGRWHALVGTVVPGDRRGRTIGIPTANLQTPILAPGPGVYAALATLPDGQRLAAAVNIGPRPTFDRPETIEAHLILPGSSRGAHTAWAPIAGLPEYGWPLTLELVSFIRETMRFASIDDLRGQLARDIDRAARLVTLLSPPPSHTA